MEELIEGQLRGVAREADQVEEQRGTADFAAAELELEDAEATRGLREFQEIVRTAWNCAGLEGYSGVKTQFRRAGPCPKLRQ